MNILILGSGGREHAFAQKIELSKLSKKLFIAPGNSGTEKTGKNNKKQRKHIFSNLILAATGGQKLYIKYTKNRFPN